MKKHGECPKCHRKSLNTHDPIGVPTKLHCVCGYTWHEPRGMDK